MPKYTCDFDAIDNTVSKLKETAATMSKELTHSKGNLDSELSNWSGAASDSMKDTNDRSYNNIESDINTIESMASYMEEASNLIQAAEDALSGMHI